MTQLTVASLQTCELEVPASGVMLAADSVSLIIGDAFWEKADKKNRLSELICDMTKSWKHLTVLLLSRKIKCSIIPVAKHLSAPNGMS